VDEEFQYIGTGIVAGRIEILFPVGEPNQGTRRPGRRLFSSQISGWSTWREEAWFRSRRPCKRNGVWWPRETRKRYWSTRPPRFAILKC